MSDNSKFDEMFNDVKTKEEFCEWAWKGTTGGNININKLAEILNTSMHRSHNYVRIERFRPHIYGVALKHKFDKKWQFVKIGYTHVDTSVCKSRMTKIEDDINKVYGNDKGKTMFVLAIDPVETKSFTEVEKTFRQKMGIPVQKKLAKKLCLPVSSEWVMTTTAFNKKFVDDIKSVVDKRNAHTGLMQNKFEKRINLPLHLNPPENINNGETVQICFINEEICLKDSGISCSPEASVKSTKKETNQGGESSLEKESDSSDSPETSGKQTKKETKQGESYLKNEIDSSESPETSGKQAKALKETKTG
ncbi:hypothetical protein CHS0354_035630 [Potamilus streckersoni]|uniref:Uncharacterized protein n=1 Tax=Potamilus streckersoni TaxID=2493646 RepID=A0AAE0RRP0_9BIVA|nr:hypothetical protein CHS0354_035630 [Potamilus streckersoni]